VICANQIPDHATIARFRVRHALDISGGHERVGPWEQGTARWSLGRQHRLAGMGRH
jgi:hypothetical protein